MSRDPRVEVRETIFRSYGHDWQDAGENFDAASSEWWGRAYRWYLRRWLPPRQDAAIADLACGQGRLLHWLRTLGYTNLAGVDISPDQVALARQVVPSVEEADVLDWLAERREPFDLLIGLDIIEHFTRDEALRFLDLCRAALKPGGRLVLQTPNADSPFGLHVRYGDITHEWAYNVNALTRLLKRAGFSAIEAREQGPVPWGYSLESTGRFIVRRLIRAGLQLWNLAETGARLPVLTRIFLIKGEKPVGRGS
jgi:2-polyprenyl-3-methyl-5-hydroxy-6-metoxy-1,4-benzoquinol methylase